MTMTRGQQHRSEAPAILAEDRAARDELITDLIAAREGAGLSQATVALRMGATQAAVSRFERQHKSPTLITVQKYARAVGVKLCVQVCGPDLTKAGGRS